jgi:hypothetical protein
MFGPLSPPKTCILQAGVFANYPTPPANVTSLDATTEPTRWHKLGQTVLIQD